MANVDHAVGDRVHERLRWRARRGLLELDLILTRFFEARLQSLTMEELEQLEQVLRLSDNDLLDLVMGRRECQDASIKPLIEMIGAH
jgi:antitoxin CptB